MSSVVFKVRLVENGTDYGHRSSGRAAEIGIACYVSSIHDQKEVVESTSIVGTMEAINFRKTTR